MTRGGPIQDHMERYGKPALERSHAQTAKCACGAYFNFESDGPTGFGIRRAVCPKGCTSEEIAREQLQRADAERQQRERLRAEQEEIDERRRLLQQKTREETETLRRSTPQFRARSKRRQEAQYKPKPCDACGLQFRPTGPRGTYCAECGGPVGAVRA